jgi:hypothetical protein
MNIWIKKKLNIVLKNKFYWSEKKHEKYWMFISISLTHFKASIWKLILLA